jgi:hypothetical protein
LSPESFVFGCNRVEQTLDHGDIEGIWTFISFSVRRKQALGFLKAGALPVQRVLLETVPSELTYLQFIFAGKFSPSTWGFNGYMANIVFGAGPGRFVE